MAGIRIAHRELRNCTARVPHPGGDGRLPKDYYLRLDEDGAVIVSETVWSRLEEARAAGYEHGFELMNTVTDPPPIVIDQNQAEVAETFRLTDGIYRPID